MPVPKRPDAPAAQRAAPDRFVRAVRDAADAGRDALDTAAAQTQPPAAPATVFPLESAKAAVLPVLLLAFVGLATWAWWRYRSGGKRDDGRDGPKGGKGKGKGNTNSSGGMATRPFTPNGVSNVGPSDSTLSSSSSPHVATGAGTGAGAGAGAGAACEAAALLPSAGIPKGTGPPAFPLLKKAKRASVILSDAVCRPSKPTKVVVRLPRGISPATLEFSYAPPGTGHEDQGAKLHWSSIADHESTASRVTTAGIINVHLRTAKEVLPLQSAHTTGGSSACCSCLKKPPKPLAESPKWQPIIVRARCRAGKYYTKSTPGYPIFLHDFASSAGSAPASAAAMRNNPEPAAAGNVAASSS